MNERQQWAAVAAIIVLAAVLRLGDLDLMEFKGDEAVAIHLTRPLVEGTDVPGAGLMSSVGIHNPPLFIYLTAAPVLISHDPLWVTGSLVGLLSLLSILCTFLLVKPRFGFPVALMTTAFYACSTWPVLYARKLWAQDVLPIFSVILLFVVVRVWEKPKTRWVALGPVLLCALWQIHFSAFALILVAAVLAFIQWRQLNWRWLAGGLVASVLMLGPYLQFQRDHQWVDFTGMKNIASGKKADGQARESEKKWTLESARWAAYVSSGAELSYSLGGATERFQEEGTGRWMARFTGALGHLLLMAGSLLAVWLAYRQRRSVHIIVAAWMSGYVLIYLLVRLEEVWPHYFIIVYPVPFLLMALPLGELATRWKRFGLPVAASICALICVLHVANLFQLRGFLKEHGGAAGDYGVTYDHKAELVDWVVAHGVEMRAPGFEYRHMVDTERRYGDVLAAADRVKDRPAPPADKRKVIVYDSLRAEWAKKHNCKDRQDFGPLVVCPK